MKWTTEVEVRPSFLEMKEENPHLMKTTLDIRR